MQIYLSARSPDRQQILRLSRTFGKRFSRSFSRRCGKTDSWWVVRNIALGQTSFQWAPALPLPHLILRVNT